MTREILNKIAKQYNINLAEYDEIFGYITPNGKWLIIDFAVNMGAGIHRTRFVGETIRKSAEHIDRHFEETGLIATDYTTQGWERISEIRWADTLRNTLTAIFA